MCIRACVSVCVCVCVCVCACVRCRICRCVCLSDILQNIPPFSISTFQTGRPFSKKQDVSISPYFAPPEFPPAACSGSLFPPSSCLWSAPVGARRRRAKALRCRTPRKMILKSRVCRRAPEFHGMYVGTYEQKCVCVRVCVVFVCTGYIFIYTATAAESWVLR